MPAHVGTRISTWTCSSSFLRQLVSLVTACCSTCRWLLPPALRRFSSCSSSFLDGGENDPMLRNKQHPRPSHLWTSRKIHLLCCGFLRKKPRGFCCQNPREKEKSDKQHFLAHASLKGAHSDTQCRLVVVFVACNHLRCQSLCCTLAKRCPTR